MSFGKKKSALPQRAKPSPRPIATTRIVRPSTEPNHSRKSPNSDDTPDMDASRTLTMNDIRHYGIGVCEGRGYPPEFCLSYGMGLVWLAERGLPSLSFLAKTIFENTNVDWKDQGLRAGPDGFAFMPCPIIGSSLLGGMIDDLVAAGPGKALNMTVGGPALLLMSRLSDHAKRHNVALHLAASPEHGPKDNPTVLTVKDGEFCAQPGSGSLYDPSRVTIRVVPPSHLPPADAFTSPAERRDTQIVQAALLDLIDLSRASAGLPPVGETPEKKPPSTVIGPKNLAEDTKDFFRNSIAADYELQRLFALLSKGTISNVAYIITNPDDDPGTENAILMTMAGSENDKFYKHCVRKSWMMESHDNRMATLGGTAYQITKTGRMALSVMLERLSLVPTT